MPPKPLEHLCVLLVDDNEFILTMLNAMLRSFGVVDVATAINGAEAIKQMQKRAFDVVLTDWRMPEMDGAELVAWIRKTPGVHNRAVPIILITSVNDRDAIISARDVGITEFIVKPVASDILRAKLDAVQRDGRRFIETPTFVGPCRRRRRNAPYFGSFNRHTDRSQVAWDEAKRPEFIERAQVLCQRLMLVVGQETVKDRRQLAEICSALNAIGDFGHEFGDDDIFAVSQYCANYLVARQVLAREDRSLIRYVCDSVTFLAAQPVEARQRKVVVDRMCAQIRSKLQPPQAGRGV